MDSFYLGGEGGIRTLGTVAGTAVFKTATFNHSVTSPLLSATPCVARLFVRRPRVSSGASLSLRPFSRKNYSLNNFPTL